MYSLSVLILNTGASILKIGQKWPFLKLNTMYPSGWIRMNADYFDTFPSITYHISKKCQKQTI